MTARKFLELMALERLQKRKEEAEQDSAYDNIPDVIVNPTRILKAPPSS